MIRLHELELLPEMSDDDISQFESAAEVDKCVYAPTGTYTMHPAVLPPFAHIES